MPAVPMRAPGNPNQLRVQSISMTDKGEITRLLHGLRERDSKAEAELFARVYDDLRALARRRVSRGAHDRTLNTTALVHEAYIRLIDQTDVSYQDRRHFTAVAARAMRNIAIDHARAKATSKRGGDVEQVVFDESMLGQELSIHGLLALGEALEKLSAESERLCRVVELRYFAGLTIEEIGEELEIGPRTVKRDWRKARAFLLHELTH